MSFLKNIGPTEAIIIGIILVLLFGGKKLSEFARDLGTSGKELKKAKKEMDNAYNDLKNTDFEDKKQVEAEPGKNAKGGVDNV